MTLPDPNRPTRRDRTFLPYPPFSFDAALPLEVRVVHVDDASAPTECLSVARCRVRPHLLGRWQRIRLELFLPAEVGGVTRHAFDASMVSPPSVRFVGRAHCAPTRLRRAVHFERAQETGWIAELEVRRDEIEGLCELEAFAVLGTSFGDPGGQYAHEEGSRLACSPLWFIEPEEPVAPVAGAFDVEYVNFAHPQPTGLYDGRDAERLREVPDALQFVVIRDQGPLILLNKHEPGIVETLQSKGTRGWRARLRDVLLGQIARAVWYTVLTESLAVVRIPGSGGGGEEEYEVVSPEHWTSHCLGRAAALAYPKQDDGLDKLLDDLGDPIRRPGLLASLAHRLGSVGDHTVRKLLQEFQA